MAKLFGDEVAVYAEDLHVDSRTHELVVEEHGAHGAGVHRVATEAGEPAKGGDIEKRVEDHATDVEHVDHVHNKE